MHKLAFTGDAENGNRYMAQLQGTFNHPLYHIHEHLMVFPLTTDVHLRPYMSTIIPRITEKDGITLSIYTEVK